MDDRGHARQAGGQHPLQKGAPSMRVNDVRALTAEQAMQLPHDPDVVSLAPIQVEDRDARGHEVFQCARRPRAADRTLHPERIQSVHELDDAEFHPARLEREDDMHHAHGGVTATYHGRSMSESPWVTNQLSAESTCSSAAPLSGPGSTSK